jgi:hypothetical protein
MTTITGYFYVRGCTAGEREMNLPAGDSFLLDEEVFADKASVRTTHENQGVLFFLHCPASGSLNVPPPPFLGMSTTEVTATVSHIDISAIFGEHGFSRVGHRTFTPSCDLHRRMIGFAVQEYKLTCNYA